MRSISPTLRVRVVVALYTITHDDEGVWNPLLRICMLVLPSVWWRIRVIKAVKIFGVNILSCSFCPTALYDSRANVVAYF